MEYRFNAEEWQTLTPAERASRCRLLAEQAKVLAAAALPGHSEAYEDLARNWLRLAEDMEREANSPPQNAHSGDRRSTAMN